MARYALVRPDNTIDRMSYNADPNVQTKVGFRWLPCDSVTPPTYDQSAETVTGPTYSVGPSTVTEVWAKRALTAQEISNAKDGKVSAIDVLQFEIAFDQENRIRVLEGKVAITKVQYRAALKARL